MTELLFGLSISPSVGDGADPIRDGRRAEDLGFDFVSTSDHPGGAEPSWEAWTMLSWIAATTSRIRIATRVLGVPYRPPAVVAKMAETLDRLSSGRLILGLGGGSSDQEFHAFGLRTPSPRDKIDGLEEAVQIIRGLWTQPSYTFAGRHYHTNSAGLEPKPDHHIPIWLGTFGNRALDVTGRVADGWIPSYGLAPPDQAIRMRERVLTAARHAGRVPTAITCAYHLQVRLNERHDRQDTDPGVIEGPSDTLAERLIGFVRLGFTAMNFTVVGPQPAKQAERLAHEVIPAVRAAC